EVERLNDTLHATINSLSRSDKLQWLLGMTLRYVPRRFYASVGGWQRASVQDHRSIIDAFARHDEEGAAEAMFKHIEHAGDLLVEHLERAAAERTRRLGESDADSEADEVKSNEAAVQVPFSSWPSLRSDGTP